MNRSETVTKLAPALLRAQRKIDRVTKSENNAFFKSKYAGLPSVIDAVKPQLNEEGIVVVQSNGKDEQGQYVETTLIHESGEWLSSRTYLILSKQDMQGLGSAITYSRRFDVSALAFLAADDDDGNAASNNKAPVLPERQSGGFKPTAVKSVGEPRVVAVTPAVPTSSQTKVESSDW